MVRTRIAPSPTGFAHIGTAYASLFNFAFARQQGGKFILRIEDTDRTRYVPGSEAAIFEGLRWLGLTYDEGPDIGGPFAPYTQSQRLPLYKKCAQELVDKGSAYYCFCSPERLAELREKQQEKHQPPMYDGYCRKLSPSETKRRVNKGTPFVIRLKVPRKGHTSWEDLIRGEVTFENTLIDDQILLKSDGFPTYHLAVVVDDYLMKISHVIRAEEWISSTPKHILLYQAFNWKTPKFAHLPLLRNPDHSKISKRKNPVALTWYKGEGYLPEAILNFLSLLGWSHPEEKEVFTLEEFTKSFSVERVCKTGPVFNLKKLNWLNGVYIRQFSKEEFFNRVEEYLRFIQREKSAPFDDFPTIVENLLKDPQKTKRLLPLVQERIKKLSELPELVGYFFIEELIVDPNLLIQQSGDQSKTLAMLTRGKELLQEIKKWERKELEKQLRKIIKEKGWKGKEFFMTIRVALSGRTATPPIFSTLEVLGKDLTLSRLQKAAELIK